MTRIEKSIVINQPDEYVFSFLRDLRHLPEWATIVLGVSDISREPIEQGTTFHETLRIVGTTIDNTDWKVTECQPPRVLAYEATAPKGGHMAVKQTIRAVDHGSHVTLEIDYQVPDGILGGIADKGYLERRNEREADHSLDNLKDLLEGRNPAYGTIR